MGTLPRQSAGRSDPVAPSGLPERSGLEDRACIRLLVGGAPGVAGFRRERGGGWRASGGGRGERWRASGARGGGGGGLPEGEKGQVAGFRRGKEERWLASEGRGWGDGHVPPLPSAM